MKIPTCRDLTLAQLMVFLANGQRFGIALEASEALKLLAKSEKLGAIGFTVDRLGACDAKFRVPIQGFGELVLTAAGDGRSHWMLYRAEWDGTSRATQR